MHTHICEYVYIYVRLYMRALTISSFNNIHVIMLIEYNTSVCNCVCEVNEMDTNQCTDIHIYIYIYIYSGWLNHPNLLSRCHSYRAVLLSQNQRHQLSYIHIFICIHIPVCCNYLCAFIKNLAKKCINIYIRKIV